MKTLIILLYPCTNVLCDTHSYALHLKIKTSGSFSPVSAISPQQKGISPHDRGELPFCWGESQPCSR